MRRLKLLRVALLGIFVLSTMGLLFSSDISAQRKSKPQKGKVCGDPTVPCKTTGTFDANDLAFKIPANAVIWESEEFYAIILTSVASPDDNCETFVPEADRLEAQGLFPKMKVFTSRCTMGGSLFYSNVAPGQQFMGVFAGLTKAEADRALATVKGSGKYPGANIRKMHVGFNGT